MIADCLSALFTLFGSMITQLFNMSIIDGVSLGGFLVAAALFILIVNGFAYLTKRSPQSSKE